MTYLLDVNALIALGFLEHEFHGKISRWVKRLQKTSSSIATTPITELGFVRVLSQIKDYNVTVKDAADLLVRLREHKRPPFVFIPDDVRIEMLPRWTRPGRQTTDGHLAALAKAHGAILTTFDRSIPGSLLVD